MVKNELGQKHVTAGDEISKCWYLLRLGFPDSSVGNESACNAGDPGSILELGRSAGEEKKLPTPVFWSGEVHGVTKSWTGLSDFHFELPL